MPAAPGQAVEQGISLHDRRAARLTGWAVVHDLWEEGDSRVRFIVGSVVVCLLIPGIAPY
ncbi:hypothetical protein ACFY7H_05780 [Streptomyces sp. NPDC012794]|uniref:hypothetical protein n=1 Tax=Streptomyces sp. NPDC012794 TaxID=3364850 RepID=UPI00367FF0FC